MHRTAVPLCLLISAAITNAQDVSDRRNWFNDPFFQISHEIANCPVPAGPYVTEAEKIAQSHNRAEKGTSCWLAGECTRPNSYEYDHDIARDMQALLARRTPFTNSTLWVTVRGRVVFIEGCVRDQAAELQIETFARSVPNVQQAVALVYTDLAARPPYRLLKAP
jgi:hypothetical protein